MQAQPSQGRLAVCCNGQGAACDRGRQPKRVFPPAQLCQHCDRVAAGQAAPCGQIRLAAAQEWVVGQLVLGGNANMRMPATTSSPQQHPSLPSLRLVPSMGSQSFGRGGKGEAAPQWLKGWWASPLHAAPAPTPAYLTPPCCSTLYGNQGLTSQYPAEDAALSTDNSYNGFPDMGGTHLLQPQTPSSSRCTHGRTSPAHACTTAEHGVVAPSSAEQPYVLSLTMPSYCNVRRAPLRHALITLSQKRGLP